MEVRKRLLLMHGHLLKQALRSLPLSLPPSPLLLCNHLLHLLSAGPEPQSALALLAFMRAKPVGLDRFSFPPLLRAMARAGLSGRAAHGLAAKLGFESDGFVQTGLVRVYSAAGVVDDARRVFDRMPCRDAVAWAVMIDGYNAWGRHSDALSLFRAMATSPSSPAPSIPILAAALTAVAHSPDFPVAAAAALPHLSSVAPLPSHPILLAAATAAISAAGRAAAPDTASAVFALFPSPDPPAVTAMVTALSLSGRHRHALALFSSIPFPDAPAVLAAVSAAAALGAAAPAKHLATIISPAANSPAVANCLVTMHAKCGSLAAADAAFRRIPPPQRSVVSWTALIHAYSLHGAAARALHAFEAMQAAAVAPNAVTFLGLLTACARAGLVQEGRRVFSAMTAVHRIQPEEAHYGAMVDLLGRVGLVDEARDLIQGMPGRPGAAVWGALLGACKQHLAVDLGEMAAGRIFDLEPAHAGAHVMLANLYVRAGLPEKAAGVRRRMRAKGVVKERGRSWAEVNGEVNEFGAGDEVDPEVWARLEEVARRVETEGGYVADGGCVLVELEGEDEEKRGALLGHGEKVALAFCLVRGGEGHVRIINNLRVCDDCHAFMAAFSKVFERDVMLRDRARFHHFSKGSCSCNGFW
ncbi:pentatricopeptide repeat (PPR) superfamily protein [Wolffia australiana]